MKISIARKNLLSEKVRFIISILGVSLSILVIFAPFGVYFGSLLPARLLPEESGAKLWVVQKGASDLFNTVSILPNDFDKRLKSVDGVKSVSSIINHPTRAVVDDKKVTVAVLGFDNKNGIAKPWNITKGTADIKSGEAVVDRSVAESNGIEIGDKIELADEDFKVVGLSAETNVLTIQYVFITNKDAARIFDQKNTVNYYLLSINGSSISEIEDAAKNIVPNSDVLTKEEIAENNAKVIKDGFLPILTLIAAVGLLVGAVVIALTVYFLTISKAKEYGVLKAIGVQDSKLYSIVLKQSSITGILGFLAGALFYYLTQRISFYLLPQVTFSLPFEMYAYFFILAIGISIISAYVPAKRINSLDPVEVFK